MLVVDPSMLSEYLPPQRRGRFLVFLDFWWPVGLLLATGLAYIFLGPTFDRFGDDSWRYLFLAAAFLPRVPRAANVARARTFSHAEGGRGGGRGAERDHGPSGGRGRARGSAGAALVGPRACRRSAPRPGVRDRAHLDRAQRLYYGLFLWLPFVLQAEKSFTIDVYLLLTLSALSQFPGYAAAIWLVDKIGRKPTLASFLLLGGLSA